MKTLFLAALSIVLVTVGYSQNAVPVKAGWNMLGAVKAGAVPDVLTTIPDSLVTGSFWGYRPGSGYVRTDTLATGFGYWVKAKSDGVIVFKNAPTVDSCRSRAFIYDGKIYHTVKIGSRCWIAENLDAGTMIDVSNDQTDNAILEKHCYNNIPENCSLLGGLYQWNEAMQYGFAEGAQGICPAGWHVPTSAEFAELSTSLGGDGNALKAVGQGAGIGTGTNSSGFSALLAGYRDDSGGGGFYYLDTLTYIWSSTLSSSWYAYFLGLFTNTANCSIDYALIANGQSVRCIED